MDSIARALNINVYFSDQFSMKSIYTLIYVLVFSNSYIYAENKCIQSVLDSLTQISNSERSSGLTLNFSEHARTHVLSGEFNHD